MHRIFIIVLCTCLLGSVTTAKSQGSGQIHPRGHLEVLMSRGVTANVFDLDADLRGSPRVRNEVRLNELFPIEAGKVVLAFVDDTVLLNRLRRTVILTEDGVWGIAPLRSEQGRDYFLNEATLRAIMDLRSDQISWGIVTKDINFINEKIALGRGEIVEVIGREQDRPVIRFEKANKITGTKYVEVAKQSAKTPNLTVTDTAIDLAVSKDIFDNIEFSQMDNASDYLQIDRSNNWGWRNPPIFQEWRKTIKIAAPFQISCKQQLNEVTKKKIENEVKATLQAKAGAAFDNKLVDIGIKIEATASTSAAWSNQYELTTQMKDVSYDTEGYILTTNKGPQKIVFGNALNCSTEKRYFISTVPGISGDTINEATLENISKSVQNSSVAQSGHIIVRCFTSYRGVIDFFKTRLRLDESLARFFASRIVQIDPPDQLVAFYKC